MGFSRQEYWSGLPFPSPVDHILSELSAMTCPSWVALHGMAHRFIELDMAVIHVISLVSFLWLQFSVCPVMEKDKRLMKASWWDRLRGILGLVLMGRAMLSKSLIQFSVDWWSCVPSLLFQFSCSVLSDSLWSHESQHARPLCPSLTPGVHSNSGASSQWCHPAISSSVIPFSSCSQLLPESGSFPMSQLFSWGGQSIGVSALASVLPMNT